MKRPRISEVINDAVQQYRKRLKNLPDENMRRRFGELLDGLAPLTEECQKACDELLAEMTATHDESQRKLREHEVNAKEVSAHAEAEMRQGAALRARLDKVAAAVRTFSGLGVEPDLLHRIELPMLDERPQKSASEAPNELAEEAVVVADWVMENEPALAGSNR
jgi:hypothetical protein